MGAHNYGRTYSFKPSTKIAAAFKMVADEDEAEYGYDSYSGSVKQATDMVEVSFKKGTRAVTKQRTLDTMVDDDMGYDGGRSGRARASKWGSCYGADLGLVKLDGHWMRRFYFAGIAAE